jgi:hypothetical protein
MQHVADYDSRPTFASNGVGIDEPEFDQLADAVRTVRPYHDLFAPSYTAGVVPASLEGLRDEVSGR